MHFTFIPAYGSGSVTRGSEVLMMVGRSSAAEAWAFVNRCGYILKPGTDLKVEETGRWTAEVVKA